MKPALSVIGRSFRDLGSDFFTTAVCNLVWLLSQVLILPGPPATLALFFVANRLAHGEVTDAGDLLRALPRYFGLGWRWGAVNLFLLLVLWGDFRLTGQFGDSPLLRLIQGFYLALLALWILVQLMALPFLFEQVQPSLRQAWRNGLVLMVKHPVFSLGTGLLTLLVLLAGIPLFLLTLAAGGLFVALVGNHAVLNRMTEGA